MSFDGPLQQKVFYDPHAVSHLLLEFPVLGRSSFQQHACSCKSCSQLPKLLHVSSKQPLQKVLMLRVGLGEPRGREGRVCPADGTSGAAPHHPRARAGFGSRPSGQGSLLHWRCESVSPSHWLSQSQFVTPSDKYFSIFQWLFKDFNFFFTSKELFSVAVLSAAVLKGSCFCFVNKYPAS